VRWLFSQLLAPHDTIACIRREALLAERAAQDHSVTVFEVTDPHIDPRPARLVVLAARSAMLDGDELGWLDATRIALSLPLTGPTAAAVTASRIAAEGRPTDWSLYSQPAMAEAREQTDLRVRPIAELLRDPLPSWKRLTDIAGALTLLVLTWPVLVLGAVLVRLSSRGPAIFRQRRAGLHGQPFVLFKFRTMVDGAEAMKQSLLRFNELKGAIFKMKNDPRVTRIGRFLRISSIDELPQLWNVLRGEMSLVGPRPPTFDEVSCYRAWHRRRLSVRPGITGLWQVSARECNDFDDRVRMDLRYIERRSLLGDLRLLSATVPAVLSRRGAM
jgi:lipopolysaccharide/colanic/teichoic acid biosynthesis glycosyltransferase